MPGIRQSSLSKAFLDFVDKNEIRDFSINIQKTDTSITVSNLPELMAEYIMMIQDGDVDPPFRVVTKEGHGGKVQSEEAIDPGAIKVVFEDFLQFLKGL